MSVKITGLPEGSIVNHYLKGTSVQRLSKNYGVARGTIHRILCEHGVDTRSCSDAQYMRNSKLTVLERRKNTMAANKALRGSKKEHAYLVRRALGVQKSANLAPVEIFALQQFNACNFYPTPLLAIDKYNIDMAFEKAKVAVEIQNNWHYSVRKAAQDASKISYLHAHGWIVLWLYKADFSGTKWLLVQHLLRRLLL